MGKIVTRDFDVASVEAEENLLIDIQFLLAAELADSGMNRAEFAKKLGVSKARLSQIFTSEANPTIKTWARLFHVLGKKLKVEVDPGCGVSTRSEGGNASTSDWSVDVRTSTPIKRKVSTDERFVALLKEAMVSNDNYRLQVENHGSGVPAGLEAADPVSLEAA